MGRTLNEDRRDPFEQLVRSHRRLEERLAALVAIGRSESVDASAVDAISEFLTRQGRRHEEDEEQTLLPRLADVPELDGVLAQIRAEHTAHHEMHARLETIARTLSSSAPTAALHAELAALAEALEDAYRTHIDVEEAVLFPAARKALGPADLHAMSDEMQARRGPGMGSGGGGRRRDQR